MLTGMCVAVALTAAQCRALRMAEDIGGNPLAALVWVESSFCAHKHNLRNRSVHGCAQMNEQAVRSVYGHPVAVWVLTYDNPVNMVLAENYLSRCERIFGWPDALAAYYWGIPHARYMTHRQRVDDPYTQAVLHKLEVLRG